MNTRRSATCRSSRRSPRTSQRRSPPSTIAVTMARSRCVRKVAVSIDLGRGQDPRQSASNTHQRDTLTGTRPLPPGRQPPRHRVGCHVNASLQEREETRHDRQASPHRGARHPGRPLTGIHRLQHAIGAGAARALRGDERQHIGRPDLIRRLSDHREEHLQVIGSGQHRIGPPPPAQELQVRISSAAPPPPQPAHPNGHANGPRKDPQARALSRSSMSDSPKLQVTMSNWMPGNQSPAAASACRYLMPSGRARSAARAASHPVGGRSRRWLRLQRCGVGAPCGWFDQAEDQEPGLSGQLLVVLGIVLAHGLRRERLDDLLDQEPGVGSGGT